MNTFSLGAQIGGPQPREAADEVEQSLRNLFNAWTGDYSPSIRQFAFLLRVDGDLDAYTKLWGIVGSQPAKRKRDWLEVEIGIPESWWRNNEQIGYPLHLADAIEVGFRSMTDLMHRNNHPIKSAQLLQDWREIRERFLVEVR
jgi:hypothetical protein